MLGKTISHYKILEKLGAGGMGVVYKAQDTTLDRFVALKFLPHHLSQSEEEKKRFIQEAKAASALDHPNVCGIYEIGESDDGQMFIAMAYYEGETLKQRIEHGAVPIAEALEITRQVAEGLSKAHEKEIVHRDIKPANIIITDDGVVKIVDFGLAKLAGESRLTKTGTTLGTVSYMSPEQTRGDQVDDRTDIWSLGVLLYEMVTGELPFRGEYEQAVFYSILNEEPEPLPELPKEVPAEFETVVRNCLEKEPADRYQTADELLTDLQQLQEELKPGGLPFKRIVRKRLPQKPLRSVVLPAALVLAIVAAVIGYFFIGKEAKGVERVPIAVVDFVNETDEKELDGLSGMLITSLEQSRRLSVLTRSRMFDILKQMGKEKVERIDETLGREICQQAGVNAMALASVKKLGRVYTIDLKVLDTDKDEYLFTDLAQGEGQESVLTMIDNLSKRTREEFNEPLEQIQAASQSVAQITASNVEAYQHYFLGEQLRQQWKREEASEEFRKAIAIDSTFGLAYLGLARAGGWYVQEYLAKKPMQKAVALIDRMPEKYRYMVRAQQARYEKGFAEGIALLKEMEQIYPDDQDMLVTAGFWSLLLAFETGESEDIAEAAFYLEKALENDEKNMDAYTNLSLCYRMMGAYEKRLALVKKYVGLSPSPGRYMALSSAYRDLRQYDMAIQTLHEARRRFPEDYHLLHAPAYVYLRQERPDEAEAILLSMIEESQREEVRIDGYWELTRFYPFVGKYREALKYRDLLIGASMNGTGVSAPLNQFAKAHLVQWGWNDTTRARQEGGKAWALKDKMVRPLYWANAALYHLITGNHFLADSIAKTISQKSVAFRPYYPFIAALRQAQNQDCTQAEAIHVDQPGLRNWSNLAMILLYTRAKCHFDVREYNKAMASLHKLQGMENDLHGYWAVFYPKSYYLLGRIHEAKGDKKLATQSYAKLLDLWKEADEDLPELIDAKARLAKLKG